MEQNYYNSEVNKFGNTLIVNYKRLFSNCLRYWYLFLISVSILFLMAYSFDRYATRVYSVDMSILIKESEEASGNAELLYNNPLVDGYRNFYNEIFIIKSFPLVHKVVNQLGLDSKVFVEGNVKETELYEKFPVKFNLLDVREKGSTSFSILLKDSSSFELTLISEDEEEESETKVFQIGDTVEFGGVKFASSFRLRNANFSQEYVGKDCKLYFNKTEQVVKSYVNKLNIEWAEEGASVVDMRINGTIVSKEIDFLNTLVSAYSFQDLEKKRTAASRSLEFIEGQLASISDSLLLYELQLERFKSVNTLTDLSGEARRLLIKLEEIEKQKSDYIVRDNYLNYLYKYISESEKLDQVVLPVSVGVNDPILTALVSKMVDLQLNLKSFISTSSEKNPIYIEKFNELGNVRKNILESVVSLQRTNKEKLKSIDKRIDVLNDQMVRLPRAERKLITIERNYKFSENLYDFLSQKRAEAGITKASAVSDIIVINPAMQLGGAIAPKTNRNYIIGLLFGIGLPFLILLLLEYLDNKIQSKEDIELFADIPVSGLIGHNKSNINLIVNLKPKSAIAESFRTLRSNLHFFSHKKKKKVFMITSSLSGEGKSFTCMNLGAVMAVSGKKTLIIGADMRKPKMYDDFGLNNNKGLSNILSGTALVKETIQSTEIPNLDLISAGPVPPNPSEMLMQDEMSAMIAELQEFYDNIIIDTPPIALVTDAFVLSPLVDHTIYLTRQGFTPLDAINNIAEYYKSNKIRNISVVLNDIKNNRIGYGYGNGQGYGYGYKYGYYEEK